MAERPDLRPLPDNIRPLAEVQKRDEVRENIRLMERLSHAVKVSGERILSFRGLIVDSGIHYGHEHSSIDEFARSVVNNALDEYLPDMEGVRRFELRPIDFKLIETAERRKKLIFIIDEVDGTTNTKRELANLKDGDIARPQAATCIGVYKGRTLDSVQAGALYTFDTGDVFSAAKISPNTFISFKNDKHMSESDYAEAHGDSVQRVTLVGYSNNDRMQKAMWEQAVTASDLRVYDGCRASSVDVINIIRGRTDAYIDGRALWGDRNGAKLQAYDIAAVIPIALGVGFQVSDVFGSSLNGYDFNSEVPIVISRSRDLHEKILSALRPLVSGRG